MDALERELLYRLLTGLGEPGHTAMVHVGTLPDGFPVALPAGSRLLGSLERQHPPVSPAATGMYELSSTQVVLETPLSGPQWLQAFKAALGPDWETPPLPGFEQSGFLPAQASEFLNLESLAAQQALHVQTRPAGEVTQVQLALNDLHPGHARMRHFPFLRPPSVKLHVPEGTQVIPSGGGGDDRHMAYHAQLLTAHPLAGLQEHFAAQLGGQGWQELTRSQQPSLTASVWRKGPQQVIYLTLEQQERHVDASMIVQAPPAEHAGMGHYTLRGD